MPRDAEATKTRIMDAAQGIVMNRGFAATSVDAIQEAAGISRGTFFYHFPTKDDLSRALIDRYRVQDAEVNEEFIARAEKLATDPLQQALIFLALHEELFEESGIGAAGCLFASYSYEAGLFEDSAHDTVVESIDHWRRLLGGKLEQAAEHHGVEIDAGLLADMAYGMLQGAFILGRVQADPSLAIQHLRQFRHFIELQFGVASPPVPAAPAIHDPA